MSQISPPVRIVAVVAVAFLAIYMVALRPKSSTPTPAATPTPAGNVNTGKPAVTQFGKAVQQAQGAAKATEKQVQGEVKSAGDSTDSATSSKSGSGAATRSTSSPAATAAAAVDVKGLPRPVAKAVKQHKVMALLFWNGRSADDHAVRAAFRHVLRFRGAVFAHVAPLDAIARYSKITQGADVQQSPTVVVVDRDMKATTLVGYVDTDTINQAVVDAARASGGLFSNGYLKNVNDMCSSTAHDLYAIPQPMTVPQARHDFRTYQGRWTHFVSAFQALPAPRKWHTFKRATLADLHTVTASNARLIRSLDGHSPRAGLLRQVRSEANTLAAPAERFNHRMDRAGLIFCGRNN